MYDDAKHRPHGTHFGEPPSTEITFGPDSLDVTLDTWGPKENLFPTIYDALQSNWGDSPSRTAAHYDRRDAHEAPLGSWERQTGWDLLTEKQRTYVEACFAGRTLQQILEMLTFTFTIDGVTRAFTHEFVRARIGSGFMQHGGRDNDWRHRPWTMPETIRRACIASGANPGDLEERDHCLVDMRPIIDLIDKERVTAMDPDPLATVIDRHLMRTKRLYAALVDAGIPWQDARRVLPIGCQTYIHGTFNYVALNGVLANRLEHIMDWEINCVTQLMLRQIHMHCPPLLAKYLGSHSDKARKAAFAGLDSWPPDGKYPNPFEICVCGHGRGAHTGQWEHPQATQDGCGACASGGTLCLHYQATDGRQRQHRREQNPFWILSPAAMVGGPIEWIGTNGVYPEDLRPGARKE
jgi:thymidylate synthase ThyX